MTLSLPGLRIAGRQGGAIRRARRAESVEDLLQPGLPAIALAVAAAVMAALLVAAVVAVAGLRRCLWRHGGRGGSGGGGDLGSAAFDDLVELAAVQPDAAAFRAIVDRTEERRVGKECVSKWRSRRSQDI